MAYQYQSVGTVDAKTIVTGTDTIAPGAPSGITAGDLIVLVVALRATPTSVTPPTGFEYLGGGARFKYYARIATGSGDTGTVSVTVPANTNTVGVFLRFSGSFATVGAAGVDILDQAVVYATSATTRIDTPALGSTPSTDGCLILYGGHHFDDIGPTTSTPNSSTSIVDWEDNTLSLWFAVSYTIQTTAATVGASFFGSTTANSATQYGTVVALLPATTTKYLKVLTHASAASASSVQGVVFSAPTGGAITGTTRYGEFTGKTFDATLESGKAVLKVPVTDFGGGSLTTSDTPVALVRNTTKTTGIISCTVIEE